jgi:2-polyprenyl-3-methyl-5-hydroxy-6-metoxy-1,4-benzoquinol methylase
MKDADTYAAGWNNESGDWQGLRNNDQSSRYREIVKLIRRYAANGRVLDVGCGEGVILDYLEPWTIAHYTGIEPSATAISNVPLKRPQDRALCCTIEQYQPESGRWNVVLFNEVLYYLDDPRAVVDKFAPALAPGGVMIISIFQKDQDHGLKALVKTLVKMIMFPKRPRSNRHCTGLVSKHLKRRGFMIRDTIDVPCSRGVNKWRVIVAEPPLAGEA